LKRLFLPFGGVAADGDAAAIVAGLSDRRLSERHFGKVAYNAFLIWLDGNGLLRGGT